MLRLKPLRRNEAEQLLRACARREITPEKLAEILSAFEEKPASVLARVHAARFLGRLEEAAEEAKAVIASAEHEEARAEAHGILGSVYRALGDPKAALLHKQRALALEKDPLRRAVALGEVGFALAALGGLKEARKRHEEAIGKLRAIGGKRARRHEGAQLSYLGVALHRAGMFAEARRAHAAALAIHREVGDRRLEGAELMHLGYVDHELGKIKRARRKLEAGLALLREARDRALEGVALSFLGALEVEGKRPERAGPLIREAIAIHQETKSKRHEATAWLHLAQHHLSRGEAAEARACLLRSKTLGEGRVEPEQHAWVLALLGSEEPDSNIEDRATRGAIDILRGRATEAPGSRARLARALRPRGLVVAKDGTHFVFRDARVDLTRRGPLARVLARLAADRKNGASVSWEELLAAGWPGERVQTEAGFARVRNALFQLRKLGLKDALQTTASGYRLRPELPLEHI